MAKLDLGDDIILAELRQKIKDAGDYPYDNNCEGWRNRVANASANKINALVNKLFGEPHARR